MASNPDLPAETVRFHCCYPEHDVMIPAPVLVLGEDDPVFQGPLVYRASEGSVVSLRPGRLHHDPVATFTPDDKILVSASQTFGRSPADHWLFHKLRLERPRRLHGRVFWFGGGSNYYHFVLDMIPRLHMLSLAGLSLDSFDYILMEPPWHSFGEELIDLFQLPREKFLLTKDVRHFEADELTFCNFVPKPASWACDYLRGVLLGAAATARRSMRVVKKRIFISRRGATWRRLANQDEVETLLERYHFCTVSLEGLSVRDQVDLFAGAEIVVAPHGAGLTNILFGGPGLKVVELRPHGRNYDHWVVFWRLSGLLGLPYYALSCELLQSHLTPDRADLKVDINHLAIVLDAALGGQQ